MQILVWRRVGVRSWSARISRLLWVVGAVGSLLLVHMSCFPFGGYQSPGPSAAESPRLKSFPPEVAEEIVYHDAEIQQAAGLQASGMAGAGDQVDELVKQTAAGIQMMLEEDVPLATVERCVKDLVDEAAQSPSIRQRGAMVAALQRSSREAHAPLDAVLHPSPEMQAELERERPAILQVAELRNSAQAPGGDEGEEQARQIAVRINGRLEHPMDEKAVKFQVLQEATKAQFQILKSRDGTMMDAIRASSSGKLKAVLDRTGKIKNADLALAFEQALAGDVAPALPILRTEFERTQAILQLYPWKRFDESRDRRQLYFTTEAALSAYLSLADHNPDSAELRLLAYQAALSLRAINPEVERRLSAAWVGQPRVQQERARWSRVRDEIASFELQRAAGHPLSSREELELVRLRAAEAELLRQLDEAAEVGRFKDKPFDAPEGWRLLQESRSADAALVSFVRYRQWEPGSRDVTELPFRYGAFVLTRDELTWSSIGVAAEVEQTVDDYASALGNAEASLESKKQAGRAFYDRAWKPLVTALGDRHQVTIVPDGALQLVPFEAGHDGEAWLTERYRINYELTERQLLPEYRPQAPVGPPLVVSGGPYADRPRIFKYGERLSRDAYRDLPGSAGEVRAISAVLPSAELVTGEQATDALFLARPAPLIVHIAAHGVFLPFGKAMGPGERGLVVVEGSPQHLPPSSRSMRSTTDAVAMSRAALVLAPNPTPSTDGFLTAYEVAAANLWGTELVVLSACETGRGKPDARRGVQGLRRAFFGAGVSSIVTSLWSVEDRATQKLMQEFYERLVAGADRVDALREASRAVRASNADPTVWAPFILFGESGPLPWHRPATAQPGQDEETRFRRAMAQRRMQHIITEMGTARWTMDGATEDAVDADVVRDVHDHQPMRMTLLGRRQSLSLTISDYSGPGRYASPTLRISAVSDPLTADIRRLHTQGEDAELKASSLEVSADSLADGFAGRFEFTLKDGRAVSGEFQLASGLPPVPAWMLRSMQREGTPPRPKSTK